MGLLGWVSRKWLLDYIRLEEDEDTAELLLKSSFLYVGRAISNGEERRYWSYPTPCGVAWVSFTPRNNCLGTEAETDIPESIKAATAAREKHPTRPVSKSPAVPADRSLIPKPIWVPEIPSLLYFPAYTEAVPFKHVAKAFAAKAQRADVGIQLWVRYFGVKLTSGRYAIIEAREKNMDEIEIQLEVADRNNNDAPPWGFFYASDLKEILGVLGRECRLPLRDCQYHWRD